MRFDPDAGLCVFEVVLGFKCDGETIYSPTVLVQADEPEELEDKVMEILGDLDLGGPYWIEEASEPYDIEEYQEQLDEHERRARPLLDELTEDELKDMVGL